MPSTAVWDFASSHHPKKFDIFVVLSVMLLKGRDCANEFNIKTFECGNNFDAAR